MGTIQLNGSLLHGPQVASDTAFPGGMDTVTLSLLTNPKPSLVWSGLKQRTINSASSFLTLTGVGTTDDVTQGDTLYFRCRAEMQLRATFNNPSGSATVSVIPVEGVFIMEFPANQYLSKLEVKGVGTIEYAISGQV